MHQKPQARCSPTSQPCTVSSARSVLELVASLHVSALYQCNQPACAVRFRLRDERSTDRRTSTIADRSTDRLIRRRKCCAATRSHVRKSPRPQSSPTSLFAATGLRRHVAAAADKPPPDRSAARHCQDQRRGLRCPLQDREPARSTCASTARTRYDLDRRDDDVADVDALIAVLDGGSPAAFTAESHAEVEAGGRVQAYRSSRAPDFQHVPSEHDMLRYLKFGEPVCCLPAVTLAACWFAACWLVARAPLCDRLNW
jgi:hypothetical protein